MKTTQLCPLEGVACCQGVTEYHPAVEANRTGELHPGDILDERFLITEVISRSGMAMIFKAQDLFNHNANVALKVPHLEFESDPGFYTRFHREEEIGLKLDHPYVLKFIPVAGPKSRPYLVTEYLRGCTLAHLLNETRPLPEKDALQIASLLCDALQHMHWRGVVHRDLKPGNIMICRDRTIRLMDFGIAAMADSRKITLQGFTATMGTPEYMSPEQVKNQRGDERSDIYCLGAVLYEMLTGSVPFQDENCWVSMNNRVTGDPIAPRKLNPNLSPEAEEIVLHAMQRDPARRYQTAAAMKADLDSPHKIHVTGYCDRLEAPSFRLSMRETPVLAGSLIAAGILLVQVLAFLLIKHLMAR